MLTPGVLVRRDTIIDVLRGYSPPRTAVGLVQAHVSRVRKLLGAHRFPTAARLVSWAGLAPVTRQSGPRSRKQKKGQGDAYLKGYCTQVGPGGSAVGCAAVPD